MIRLIFQVVGISVDCAPIAGRYGHLRDEGVMQLCKEMYVAW